MGRSLVASVVMWLMAIAATSASLLFLISRGLKWLTPSPVTVNEPFEPSLIVGTSAAVLVVAVAVTAYDTQCDLKRNRQESKYLRIERREALCGALVSTTLMLFLCAAVLLVLAGLTFI